MTIIINKGNNKFQPSERIIQELTLLEKVAKNIVVGKKTFPDSFFTAVLIKGMPLSSNKFRVSNIDILFLLPSQYPRISPVGCYLNYPWSFNFVYSQE